MSLPGLRWSDPRVLLFDPGKSWLAAVALALSLNLTCLFCSSICSTLLQSLRQGLDWLLRAGQPARHDQCIAV